MITSPARFVGAVVAALALSTVAAHADGDIKAGRKKALQCQTCHGLDGMSKLPEAPNLGGQSATYLTKALMDYQSGARKNDMMSLVAPTLSAADIADLTAYFSAIQVTMTPPAK